MYCQQCNVYNPSHVVHCRNCGIYLVGTKYAGFWRRFVAGSFDLVIVYVACGFLALFIGAFLGLISGSILYYVM